MMNYKILGLAATIAILIGLLTGLRPVGPSPAKVPPATPYNVLFLAADDLKPLLGCYGSSQMHTPNIDRLARMGTVFTKNYCQQAVCAPTRASLLTGQRPDYTRVWDLQTLIRDMNPDILTLPQYFRQQGYVTTGIGKIFDQRSVDKANDAPSWSLPYAHAERGDFAAGYGRPNQEYQNPETRRRIEQILADAKANGVPAGQQMAYLHQRFTPFDEGEDIPDDAYPDGAVSRKASRMMNELAKEKKPFFLAVGFRCPHLPFVAPKKYWDLYDRSKLSLAPFQQKSQSPVNMAYQESWELTGNYTDNNGGRLKRSLEPFPDSVQRRLIHGYYASVSYLDAQVGLLLDALKANGLDKNTIVVFWGDHGWHLGDHAMWCKHTNFEQATRAPLIVAAPGFKGNQKSSSMTEFVDVFPTICELAGLKTPDGLAGKSLLPLLKNPAASVKTFAHSEYPRSNDKVMGYAIRTDRYRYVAWLKNDFRERVATDLSNLVEAELYDYEKDPDERVNLAMQTAYAPIVKQHTALLADLLKNQRQPALSAKR
ncbi:sulfatase [Spirosoma arcticum]